MLKIKLYLTAVSTAFVQLSSLLQYFRVFQRLSEPVAVRRINDADDSADVIFLLALHSSFFLKFDGQTHLK